MQSYALGPVKADDPRREPPELKMGHDLVLALRAMDWLPATFKSVIRYLRSTGWTDDAAPDALWNATVVRLFDQGALQLSFKRDGSPFEVW